MMKGFEEEDRIRLLVRCFHPKMSALMRVIIADVQHFRSPPTSSAISCLYVDASDLVASIARARVVLPHQSRIQERTNFLEVMISRALGRQRVVLGGQLQALVKYGKGRNVRFVTLNSLRSFWMNRQRG